MKKYTLNFVSYPFLTLTFDKFQTEIYKKFAQILIASEQGWQRWDLVQLAKLKPKPEHKSKIKNSGFHFI